MSRASLLSLSSVRAREQSPNPNSINPADYTTYFRPELIFPQVQGQEYILSFVSGSVWYSVPNISDSKYNNATWGYSNGGPLLGPFVIPDGTYSFEKINDQIHEVMFLNGDYTGTPTAPVFDIEILPDTNQLRVIVEISGGYSFQVYDNFSRIIGFPAGNINVTSVAPNKADITYGIDEISINCDLVEYGASYSGGTPGTTIHSFRWDNIPPGSLQVLDPFHLVPLRFVNPVVSQIRIFYTDPKGQVVDFRDEDTTVILEIKTRPKI